MSIHVETSPLNHYGERVVANELVDPAKPGRSYYRCQEGFWKHDHEQWCKAYRQGDKLAPSPMSEGHCMFINPTSYGLVPKGESRQSVIRRAVRNTVIGNLHGWDRELRQSAEGMRQLAKIVRATVNAKLQGESLGGTPYVACIMAGL